MAPAARRQPAASRSHPGRSRGADRRQSEPHFGARNRRRRPHPHPIAGAVRHLRPAIATARQEPAGCPSRRRSSSSGEHGPANAFTGAFGMGQRRTRRRLAPARSRRHGVRLRSGVGRVARRPAAVAVAAVHAGQHGAKRAAGAQLFRQPAARQRGDQKAHRPTLPDRNAGRVRPAASHRPRLRGRRSTARRRRHADRRRPDRGNAALGHRDRGHAGALGQQSGAGRA